MAFKPDYKNLEDAARNKQAKRTPLYEHIIGANIMERITGEKFVRHYFKDTPDYDAFFRPYCRFFLDRGYDTVSHEMCITEMLPGGGALGGHKPGVIADAEAFEKYPFDRLTDLYIQYFKPKFEALKRNMPDGMRAVGGVGNGVFEIVQDLTGYENLCMISYDDPELYARLFVKVGDAMESIWKWVLSEYADLFCVFRFGDDLGYKSNTLLPHEDIKEHVIPQYKRIVELVHSYQKPFLLHSCGCIFDVMDDIIEVAKIDAKHSNEDQIAPFRVWVDKYGSKIGNFGGIDTDHLVRLDNDKLEKLVLDTVQYCASGHGGFAAGSGNSIPDYVDPEKYLIMVNAVRKFRGD